MPFVRDFGGDFEEFDDSDMKPKPGESEYVPPEAFRYEDVTDELEGQSRIILDFLLAAGATEFLVNYDGGHDEGFAHADSFRIDGWLRPVDEVIDALTKPEVIAKLATADNSRSVHANQRPDRDVVRYAIEELADELASRLLGRGYGTGEYTMYGAFVANLATLEITDDENAKPHDGMD